MKAFEKYSATLLQAWQASEASETASARYADYFRSIQEVFAAADTYAHINSAFRRYAADLKDAWSRVDPEVITVEEMAAIVEGMSWVTGIIGVVQRAAGG